MLYIYGIDIAINYLTLAKHLPIAALQNEGTAALSSTTPMPKHRLPHGLYSKTAKLINMVNTVFDGDTRPENLGEIQMKRPPKTNEDHYSVKHDTKEVPLGTVMKLLQKNYDANKNLGQDKEETIRVHIIRNPEVLERFKQSLRSVQIDRSTSSSSESTDEDYFDRTFKALMLRRNSVNFRLSSDISSEATKEESEVAKVTASIPKSVEVEVTPFKLPFEYDEIKNMEILINSEEFQVNEKKKLDDIEQKPPEDDAWEFITKNYKWGEEAVTEKSAEDPNWENTKRRETENNWESKEGDWHKKSNDWDQKDNGDEKKVEWNKKSDDWNKRENSWEKKEAWNKKSDDRNKKSEDWDKKQEDWNKKSNSWEKKDDWNRKPDDWNKKSEDRNKKSDDWNKKSDDWNKKSDDWNKKSDDWNKKSNDWNKKSDDWNKKSNDWNKKSNDWDKKSDDWNKKSDTYKKDHSWEKKDDYKKSKQWDKKDNEWNRESNWDVKDKKTTEKWDKKDNNWNREDEWNVKVKDNWEGKWDNKDIKKKKDNDDWDKPIKDDGWNRKEKKTNDWDTWTTKDESWNKKRDSWDKGSNEKSDLRTNKRTAKENDYKRKNKWDEDSKHFPSSERDKTRAMESYERDGNKEGKSKKKVNEWDSYVPKNDDYYKPKRSKRVDSFERNNGPSGAVAPGHSFGRTPIPFVGKKRIYDK